MMNEGDTGERQTIAAFSKQPPQESGAAELPPKPEEQLQPGGGSDGASAGVVDNPSLDPTYDEARFAAGVVKLYETLLKEPIPDEMLALINKIEKQERS